MTATVTTASTPLTVGQVNFCDAAAKLCCDIHLLGTAQLTPAGIASFKFIPAPGSHSYKAIFLGTNNAAASTSGTAGLTVTGLFPSVTSIAEQGDAATDYTLTATVVGAGASAPTGTVSFLDATNGNAVLGTAILAGATGLTLTNSTYPLAPGDFALPVIGLQCDYFRYGVASCDPDCSAIGGDSGSQRIRHRNSLRGQYILGDDESCLHSHGLAERFTEPSRGVSCYRRA